MEDSRAQHTPWGPVRFLHRIEDGLLVVLLLSMILLAFGQIILRNFLDTGYIWIDPLLRVMVLWIGMIGALVATRENKQISIDVLTRVLPPPLRHISRIITRLFAATVAGIIAWHSILFILDEWSIGNEAFAHIPAWSLESIIPIGFGIIALRYLLEAFSEIYAVFMERRP